MEEHQFTVEYDDNPNDAVDSIKDILENHFGLIIIALDEDEEPVENITYEIRRT